ncbi:MAG: hypothetical protein C5B50_05405 [Verrucomicrobia bacterium]|nr:MAG: hypothetical protein C5B50_05405 [Verrucomicrobiota bacterium]
MKERISPSSDQRVHSKQFRVVARTLANPESPIRCILHIKSLDLLGEIAQQLESLQSPGGDQALSEANRILEDYMRQHMLLVSLREGIANRFPQLTLPTSAIRPSAWCKVLYLPPFYLVHTPGLFERISLEKDGCEERPAHSQRTRFKL